MKTILFFIYAIMAQFIVSCGQNKTQTNKLQTLWETKGFDTPESVCFDAVRNVFYISNIGGNSPSEKDNNGFISKLNPNGTISELKWIDGLNAPKGMAVCGNFLFVTDINKIHKIDILTGAIAEELQVENAIFLNDIAAPDDGTLFITDSRKNVCFKYSNGKSREFISDTSFNFMNGIILDGASLIIGTGNNLIKADTAIGNWKVYISETGGVDGLAKVEDSKYVISDWTGHVYIVSDKKTKQLVIDTTPIENMNAADFYYDAADKLIYIPTFRGNSISCYQLETGK